MPLGQIPMPDGRTLLATTRSVPFVHEVDVVRLHDITNATYIGDMRTGYEHIGAANATSTTDAGGAARLVVTSLLGDYGGIHQCRTVELWNLSL